MSGLSDAAKALLLAQYAPTAPAPPDSFTVREAIELWGVESGCAESRIRRMLARGQLEVTMIGRVAHYHPPQPATK